MTISKTSLASLSLLACFFADQSVLAVSATTSTSSRITPAQEFKLLPVIDVWGYTGRHTIGEGLGLVPLMGDQNNVLYVAAEGKLANKDNGWMAGAGVGYRKVIDQRILGGYVIADHNDAFDQNKFWVINPGIESLGMIWDFRVNGYFPTKRSWSEQHQFVDFEDHCGIYDDVRFEKHKQFDRQTLVTTQGETVTGLGADAEIGRTIPIIDNLKGYIGGYYFNNKDTGHVNGGSARVALQVTNNLGIELIDTYDNQHKNTAMVGIKLSLGGFNKDDVKRFGISARLMDPIEHNIATAANGYSVPILSNEKITYKRFGAEILEHDNIWFFKQGDINASKSDLTAGDGDGTFEHPFDGLNPGNVAVVNNNFGSIGAVKDKFPLLYFAPGTYSLNGFVNDRFSLPLGWGMFGRSAGYNAPAFGDQRELFLGGIDIVPEPIASQSDSDSSVVTTLNSIHILNDQPVNVLAEEFENSTVFIKDAGNVVIKNSVIESQVNNSGNKLQQGGTDAVAIYLENAVLNFDKLDCRHDGDTLVYGNSSLGSGYGIFAIAQALVADSSSLTQGVDETTVINFNAGNNSIRGETTAASSTGIFASGITGHTEGTGAGAVANMLINFNDGTNTISSNAPENTSVAINLDEIKADGGATTESTINFNGGNNTINAFSANGTVSGVSAITTATTISDTAKANINFLGGNNTIAGIANGTSFFATGLSIDSTGVGSNTIVVNFQNGKNSISANNDAGIGSGIFAFNEGAGNKMLINFDGGENTIAGTSPLFASGIWASALASLSEVNITFNGGKNTIIASNTGNTDFVAADGILTNTASSGTATIRFNNTIDKVKFIVNTGTGAGVTRTGINATGAGSSILDKDGQFMTPGNILNYATFISNNILDIPQGKAVVWSSDPNPGNDWGNLWTSPE